MRFDRIFQYVAMILLISTLVVKTAHADGRSLELTLDGGFVARPVSLDVFDASARVSWDATSLVRPTKLILSSVSDGALNVSVEDIDAFAADAKLRIGLVSSVIDHPALRVEKSDGSTVMYSATLEKGLHVSDIPVSNSMNISVVSNMTAIQIASSNDRGSALDLTDDHVVLTLDSGFVNRAVSLDLFGGEVTVAWDAKTLVKPTVLTVTSARGGVWQEQASAANAIDLVFEDPSAISTNGTFLIKHRALRPPTSVERPNVNVFSTSTSTRSASFVGTSMMYSHAAEST